MALFTDLLNEGNDLAVRRGVGLALTRLKKWDEALPHLRFAHSAEEPASPTTTGALAQCLANAAGNGGANIREALGLISSLNVRADADWARRAGAVFAAAQAAGIPVSSAEVAELAGVLASTNAADATAAAVYDLLATTEKVPDAFMLECARLYVRAAHTHGVNLPADERLFDLAMTERGATRSFFAAHEWDFAGAERLYLERWAGRHPGTFPTAPGGRYAVQAEAALLADARRLAAHSRPEAARAVGQLILKLNPAAGSAYDLLAEIAFRRGDRADAAQLLKAWHGVCPSAPAPLARLAALVAGEHRPVQALATARHALDRAAGPARVPYLLFAARLALAAGKPGEAVELFDECLDLAPEHPTALAGRAALAWTRSDFPTLVRLAERMATVPAEDPWFHYLAGAAALLAGHLDQAEVSARHCANGSATATEGRHLLALVRDRSNDGAGAAELLRAAAGAGGAAADHAIALQGQAAWRTGDFAGRCGTGSDFPPLGSRPGTWRP